MIYSSIIMVLRTVVAVVRKNYIDFLCTRKRVQTLPGMLTLQLNNDSYLSLWLNNPGTFSVKSLSLLSVYRLVLWGWCLPIEKVYITLFDT